MQRPKRGIWVDAGTGGIGILRFPPPSVIVPEQLPLGAVGDNRILECHRVTSSYAAASDAGTIAGEGAVTDGQHAAVADAAAVIAGAIAGEGAVVHGDRPVFAVDAAAVVALLPMKVLLLTVTVPLWLWMPPPKLAALLPARTVVKSQRAVVARCRRPVPLSWPYCWRRCCCSRSTAVIVDAAAFRWRYCWRNLLLFTVSVPYPLVMSPL